jgi:hypothetical protein
MLHVKQIWNQIKSLSISGLVFYVLLISLPFQTRIIYSPSSAYIDGYFSYPLAYFLYLSDILFVGLIVSQYFNKIHVSRSVKHISMAGLALFIWIALSLFHVKQLAIGVYQTLKWLEFLLLLIMVPQIVKSYKSFITTAWIVFASGVGQAILGIWQFHVQHSLGLGFLGEYLPKPLTPGATTIDFHGMKLLRAYGTFPHPNVFGAFLIVSLIFGIYLDSRETNRKTQILAGFGLVIILLGTFVSFSRVAWATSVLICLTFMFHNWFHRNIKKASIILAIGIVSCATIMIFWRNYLFARVTALPNSNSVMDRGTFNHFGLQILKNYPILGSGVGNYIPMLREMFHVQPWQYQPAHNIFIYLAASLGLVGLGLFLWLLWEIFRFTWNTKPSALRFTLLVLGASLLFMSMFDHFLVTIQQGQLLFFTSLGLIAAYRNLGHNDVEQN